MSVPTPHAAALGRIPVREAQVDVDWAARTRYWEYGPEDAATTVLLVHGYRGDHHGLEPVIAHAARHPLHPPRPARVRRLDAADRGAAHRSPAYEQLADGVRPGARACRRRRSCFGHSFGSMITTHAIADGLPARALILVNPISTDPQNRRPASVLLGLTRGYYGVSRRLPDGDRRRRSRQLAGRAVHEHDRSWSPTTDALRTWIHEEHHRYFNGFANARTVAESFDASTRAPRSARTRRTCTSRC